ncbi:MAG TPA: PLD nuclease N-terminal domain-containing protein [Dermatophilaceae bacterium]|nr:PLD nuclease N-terminal domain-containing protein [Dermatophilaceae bacterium]
MIRFLPLVVELAVLVYCLIDISQRDEREIRNLPKMWWVVLVILLPIIGGVAWLVAGRPQRYGYPPARPLAPDDDPEFLRRLRQETETERRLREWEDDLARREQELGHPDDTADPKDEPGEPEGPARPRR